MNSTFRNSLVGGGVAIASIVGLIVFAYQPESVRWKEEVKLSSGQVIIVDRLVVFGGPHEIGQPSSPSRWEVRFSSPGTEGTPIFFESKDGETPILLEFEKDVPYLGVYLSTGMAEYMHRCPSPPYVFFRYVDKQWREIPLADFPARFSVTNLSPYTRLLREGRGNSTVTVVDKETLVKNNIGLAPSVKQIVRPHGARTVYGERGCPARG